MSDSSEASDREPQRQVVRELKKKLDRLERRERILKLALTSFGLARRLRDWSDAATLRNPLPRPETERLVASFLNRLLVGSLLGILTALGTATALVLQTHYVRSQVEVMTEQAREMSQALRASNRQSLAERSEHILLEQSKADYCEIHNKALRSEKLTPTERLQYSFSFAAVLRMTEESFLQRQDGLVSSEYWSARANNVLYRMRAPVLREVWPEWRKQGLFSHAFAAWLDEAIAQRYPTAPTPK